MTKLEKLNNRLSEITTILDAVEAAKDKLIDQERVDLVNVLEKFFTAEEGDVVECSHRSINIRKKGDDKFNNFLTIYVEDSWDVNDDRSYDKLIISNSSFRTDEVSEWIVERFQKQAFYTKLAVDFQDDILAEMNQIGRNFTQDIIKLTEPVKDLRKEYKKIFEEIQAIEKAARLEALTSEEGLEVKGFERERFGRKFIEFPSMDVKFDWRISNIRGIRIDRTSASGKSADITLKVKREEWIPSSGEWIEKIVDQKIERVRMEKIDEFLRYNQVEVD